MGESETVRQVKRLALKGKKLLITDQKGNVLKEYQINSATSSQIKNLRIENSPFCLIKYNEQLIVAKVPKSFSLSYVECPHLCSMCTHCYARSESYGGCIKICDFPLVNPVKARRIKLHEGSQRIEKYPFITFGIEVNGCFSNSFIVLKCENFKEDTKYPIRL